MRVLTTSKGVVKAAEIPPDIDPKIAACHGSASNPVFFFQVD
jgi:hypothetical protein